MSAPPRKGTCTKCDRPYVIRPDGTLRHHLVNVPRRSVRWGQTCKGASKRPKPTPDR